MKPIGNAALLLSLALLAAGPDVLGFSTAPMQVNTLDRNDVGALFNSAYQAARLVPPGWTGNAQGCVPGDTSAAFKQAQIDQVNWNRAMAGVPAQVQFDSTNLSGEQQLAVMLAANRMLSHAPPSSWLCYTAAAAEAAGKSNIGLSIASIPLGSAVPPPGIVSGYMQDGGQGNNAVGHRRWLLQPQTTQMTIGLGQAIGTDGLLTSGHGIRVVYPNAFDPWPPTRWGYAAWPPPGFVPWQEAHGRWSITVENANFSAATVRVTYGTAIVPTTIVNADSSGNIAPAPALVWEFSGVAAGGAFDPLAPTANYEFNKPPSDTTYVVHVDNVLVQGQSRSFQYTVVVFDPATHEADFNALFENGWWWNAATSGSGFFIEKQGNVLFIAAYLYADDGRPRWLAVLCTLDSATSCAGTLDEYVGGALLGGAYKPPMPATHIGQVRLTFNSRTSATLQWPGGTLQLERLTFGGNRFDGTTTGWWWNDVESGTGWGWEIQGTTFVIVGYFYDSDGAPVWYLGSGTVSGGNVLSGRLQRYSGGQTLTGPYHPPSATIVDAGALTLTLIDPNTATLVAGGRQVTLKRFIFGR